MGDAECDQRQERESEGNHFCSDGIYYLECFYLFQRCCVNLGTFDSAIEETLSKRVRLLVEARNTMVERLCYCGKERTIIERLVYPLYKHEKIRYPKHANCQANLKS